MARETDLMNLMSRLESLENRLKFQERLEGGGGWTYLTSPLTSTSWDGDSYSTTGKTKIDLSAVFGVPAGVKAVLVKVQARDSGSASSNAYFALGPNNIVNSVSFQLWIEGVPNDERRAETAPVPCDENGDIYYQLAATGTGTMDVWITIWGYYQ